MRRLLPLVTLAALAVAPAAAGAAQPKLPTDAAAMSAASSAAVKVERCRSKTIDYTRCDTPNVEVRLPRGALVEASQMSGYTLSARSRQGRRFTIARAEGALIATCTPAGRGRCGPAGTWRPKPKPVMSPAWGTEWLAHERELVARVLTVVDLIERCRASSADYTPCRTPEVDALARAGFHPLRVELEPDSYLVAATSNGSTEFVYQRMADGTVDRACRFFRPLVSPCDGERW